MRNLSIRATKSSSLACGIQNRLICIMSRTLKDNPMAFIRIITMEVIYAYMAYLFLMKCCWIYYKVITCSDIVYALFGAGNVDIVKCHLNASESEVEGPCWTYNSFVKFWIKVVSNNLMIFTIIFYTIYTIEWTLFL